MSGLKIVTIGGGSSYTPEIIEGFIRRYEELPVRELWLVDIETGKEKLEIIGNLAKRMVKKAGVPITIYTTLNRREALPNADFVTTQFRVGSLDARIKDERIPLRHGYIGQETNGAGGMFKALRTIPVMLEIDHDMAELCPDAWLINFTNPSGIVTEGVLRYGKTKKIIGLCNVPIGMEMAVAKLFSVDSSRIRIDFAGLNHMVFGLSAYLDGNDITKSVIDKIADGKMGSTVKNVMNIDWVPEFVTGLSIIPCPYHRYYFKRQELLEKELEEFSKGETRAEIVKKLEDELFQLYKDPELDSKPSQLEQRGGAYYSDAACRLISSIYNDKGDIQPVDTLNNGALAVISPDSVVEVSCVITKNGPRPLTMGELPIEINGLVQQIKSFERVVIDAAVTGDYKKALLAMTINPLVSSDTMAKVLLDEMLAAHQKDLPQFSDYFASKG
ncbi:6-phospho-beta-glucosidase [Pelosinus propionicus]|uniref:6-phospho-beta-glucosidase n=1 Tax=Pelosinus propionicus DSM 13327 TaxID=1123291 RepID=A0A1I4LZK0_9FIRM|nr:6-phospho-beta-glucosidase [Pelosinus propionicus]SFL96431.1 6-phospho-beta-glucosidase [Pelosinus propionicus DSM 13327]